MTFAQTLKKLRTDAGLTQEQLAHACGYSGQSRIGNYESSQPKARQPKPDELPVIARALGISVGQLFGESQTLRLDAMMLSQTYKVLVSLDPVADHPLTLENVDDAAHFVQVYEMRAAMPLYPSDEEWVEFGLKLATLKPTGGDDGGGGDAMSVEGTGKGKVAGKIRRKA